MIQTTLRKLLCSRCLCQMKTPYSSNPHSIPSLQTSSDQVQSSLSQPHCTSLPPTIRRHIHTDTLLHALRPVRREGKGFGVLRPQSNVIGLVHPELMNRMKIRFPVMWLSIFTVGGTCTYLMYSSMDGMPMFGAAMLFYPVFILPTMWYNSRCIGKMVLNDDSTVTVSHLNMFGRRVDKVVPMSHLQFMTKHDHKQWIGGKMLFIDWDEFKIDSRLWEMAIPSQKQKVLIPESMKKERTS